MANEITYHVGKATFITISDALVHALVVHLATHPGAKMDELYNPRDGFERYAKQGALTKDPHSSHLWHAGVETEDGRRIAHTAEAVEWALHEARRRLLVQYHEQLSAIRVALAADSAERLRHGE